MASPQVENGFTKIANEIAEALCRTNLSAYETRILWFILRKTYGWHKKSDRISYSQFEETGITRRHIGRTLKRLAKRNIITISGAGQRLEYSLQKDYVKWQPLPKEVTVAKPLPIQGEPLPKEVNTKEKRNYTKERGRNSFSSSPEENKMVKELFATLKERRGYDNATPGAEARAIRWMLQHKYTPSEILLCYDDLKTQVFWRDKTLTMVSVQKQIGEWRTNKTKRKAEETKWKMR